MPIENTKFPEPLSINRPTKGAKIAATIRDKVYSSNFSNASNKSPLTA